MLITPLGDSALIVRVCDEFKAEESLAQVLSVQKSLEAAAIPGVVEIVPSYTTIGIFYDPGRVPREDIEPAQVFDWLTGKIRDALLIVPGKSVSGGKTSRVIEIPVCYDPEFALDLSEIAQRTDLSLLQIADLHCAPEYLVNCVGFSPGFPYLSGLPEELATPRRATPRKNVPAGSVAIGGAQTGIYLRNSPGGWNVIGRTPATLFDVSRDPPALLRTGDRVRFRAITRAEFDELKS